jgi:hypothetical protein
LKENGGVEVVVDHNASVRSTGVAVSAKTVVVGLEGPRAKGEGGMVEEGLHEVLRNVPTGR